MGWVSFLQTRQVDRGVMLRWALLCVAMLDELVSGLPVIALPLMRDDLGLSYSQAGLIFTVAELSSMLIDPGLNLFSDGRSKRGLVLLGMLGLVTGFALVGSTSSFGWLLLAFALIGPAGGAAVGLAQAALIDQAPDAAPRTMTRWTILSAVGDLLAPITAAVAAGLHLGWRSFFWLGAALWLSAAAVIAPQRFPQPSLALADQSDKLEQPVSSVRANLRVAWHTPHLLRWVGIVLVTAMLDEVFLGFAALLLQEKLHADTVAISVAVGAQMVGGLLGLVVLDRVQQRFHLHHLLICQSLVTLVGVVGFLNTHSIWIATATLFVLGLGVSGWYPLAKGAAYTALPGRSGTVRALASVGAPFEVALPFVVGLVAEHFGITAGVGLLGLAPVLVLVLVPWRSNKSQA